MAPACFAVTFPSAFSRVPSVAARIRAFCLSLAMGDEEASTIELCVVEAVNNSIEHACALRDDLEIEVRAKRCANELRIEISDDGAPVAVERLRAPIALDPTRSHIDALQVRGRGIPLLHALMDEVSYSRRGGRNTLSLVRHYDPPG